MSRRVQRVRRGVGRICCESIRKVVGVSTDIAKIARWPRVVVDLITLDCRVDCWLIVVTHLGLCRRIRHGDTRYDDCCNHAQNCDHSQQFQQREPAIALTHVLSAYRWYGERFPFSANVEAAARQLTAAGSLHGSGCIGCLGTHFVDLYILFFAGP
jgi:hypothetical protein